MVITYFLKNLLNNKKYIKIRSVGLNFARLLADALNLGILAAIIRLIFDMSRAKVNNPKGLCQ